MALEIERKFLVDIDKLKQIPELKLPGQTIKQAYIQTQTKTVVRIRVNDTSAFLTIKGENIGATRLEFEYPIPLTDAEMLIQQLCSGPVIDKTRYEIKHEEYLWEVDIFHGENDGLIVAEIELQHEDAAFEKPSWITQEVTGETKYYNSSLLNHPFCNWQK